MRRGAGAIVAVAATAGVTASAPAPTVREQWVAVGAFSLNTYTGTPADLYDPTNALHGDAHHMWCADGPGGLLRIRFERAVRVEQLSFVSDVHPDLPPAVEGRVVQVVVSTDNNPDIKLQALNGDFSTAIGGEPTRSIRIMIRGATGSSGQIVPCISKVAVRLSDGVPAWVGDPRALEDLATAVRAVYDSFRRCDAARLATITAFPIERTGTRQRTTHTVADADTLAARCRDHPEDKPPLTDVDDALARVWFEDTTAVVAGAWQLAWDGTAWKLVGVFGGSD